MAQRELDPLNNNSNGKVPWLTTIVNTLFMIIPSLFIAMVCLPREFYYFFHSNREVKYCPHFMVYWGWGIAYAGLAIFGVGALTFFFGSGTFTTLMVSALIGGLLFPS